MVVNVHHIKLCSLQYFSIYVKKIESLKKCVDNYYSNFFQTAETLQIKGLAEKFESVGNLLTNSTGSSSRKPLISSSSLGSSRLLSVPSQHSVGSRQMSTESLPEYFNRFVILRWAKSKLCNYTQCIGQINFKQGFSSFLHNFLPRQCFQSEYTTNFKKN